MHQIGYSGKPQLAGNLIELNFINDSLLERGQGQWERISSRIRRFLFCLGFCLKHFKELVWALHMFNSTSGPSPPWARRLSQMKAWLKWVLLCPWIMTGAEESASLVAQKVKHPLCVSGVRVGMLRGSTHLTLMTVRQWSRMTPKFGPEHLESPTPVRDGGVQWDRWAYLALPESKHLLV